MPSQLGAVTRHREPRVCSQLLRGVCRAPAAAMRQLSNCQSRDSRQKMRPARFQQNRPMQARQYSSLQPQCSKLQKGQPRRSHA